MVESVLDSKQPYASRTSAPKQQRGIDAAACWIDRFHRENAVRTVLQSSPPYFSAALANNCVDDDHTKGLVIDAAAKRIVENFTRSVTDLKFLASVLEEVIAAACKAKLERSSRISGMKYEPGRNSLNNGA